MGRVKLSKVFLSGEDRRRLAAAARTGSHSAFEVRRARILLELDENRPDGPAPTQRQVAAKADVAVGTVQRVARQWRDRDGDLDAVLTRKKRLTPPVEPKLTGDVEARLIAKACTKPPPGHARWSLRLLEKHVLLTEGMPGLDHSTIGRAFRKHDFNLG
jgi:transposase